MGVWDGGQRTSGAVKPAPWVAIGGTAEAVPFPVRMHISGVFSR